MTTATVTELPATAAGLLAFARSRREAADRMEAELLQAAVHWALLHPARGEGDEAGFTLPGSEHVEPIAGEGCPAVSEFCIAEFGAVVGLPTVSANALPRPGARAGPPPAPAVAPGTGRHLPSLEGAPDRRHHHPCRARARGCRLRRPPGRALRTQDRNCRGRPARRRGHRRLPPRPRRQPPPATPRTPGTSPSRMTRISSTAPCASRPSSTLPTPSTSATPLPAAPRRASSSGRRAPGRPPGQGRRGHGPHPAGARPRSR